MLSTHVKKSHNETRTPPCFVKGLRRSEEGLFGVWGVVLGKECPSVSSSPSPRGRFVILDPVAGSWCPHELPQPPELWCTWGTDSAISSPVPGTNPFGNSK